MADEDEGQAPARPGSRGPRVVTGDMKRATAAARVVTGPGVAGTPVTPDDVGTPTETLVTPGSAPARAPAAPAGRRPRGSAASPPPPPPPPPEPEADVEPEPWRPIEVTRNIPPPVHRSAAPPPAPATGKAPRAPKPPKPGKPAPAPPAAKPAKAAGSGAGTAFLLAVVSLVSAGILAIPALILAGRAKKRGGGGGLVTAARLVAIISLVGWVTVAGIVVANVARPDGVDYASLEPGDCIDTPEGTEVRRLTVRSCDEAHDAEVFAVVIHPAAPTVAFPGADALLQYAAATCLGQPFTDYVGVPRGQSTLTEFEIVPESEAWHEGRRGLVCAVDNADRSPLTASVRGTAK